MYLAQTDVQTVELSPQLTTKVEKERVFLRKGVLGVSMFAPRKCVMTIIGDASSEPVKGLDPYECSTIMYVHRGDFGPVSDIVGASWLTPHTCT
jgi:hypothetical protein